MRRWWAIIRATALETISEPLSLMLTLSAVVTVVFCSAMHFHQYGEPSRMARDAGLSAILVFGVLQAVFCTIKAFRREIESGTLQMALAHPISRPAFFLAKSVGALVSSVIFILTVYGVMKTVVVGAETGFWLARMKGDIPLVWAPAVWATTAVVILPLLIGAAFNGFAHRRFTTTASVTALLCAWTACPIVSKGASVALAELVSKNSWLGTLDVTASSGRFLPAVVGIALTFPVFVLASAAFAVRFRDNAAASLAGLVFAVSVPALGNYYLSDALAKGGTIPWSYVGWAALAVVPFLAAFAGLGLLFFKDRDVG